MSGLRTEAIRVKTKPKYGARSSELLARCREFWQDPEHERAFQEWKKGKEAKK